MPLGFLLRSHPFVPRYGNYGTRFERHSLRQRSLACVFHITCEAPRVPFIAVAFRLSTCLSLGYRCIWPVGGTVFVKQGSHPTRRKLSILTYGRPPPSEGIPLAPLLASTRRNDPPRPHPDPLHALPLGGDPSPSPPPPLSTLIHLSLQCLGEKTSRTLRYHLAAEGGRKIFSVFKSNCPKSGNLSKSRNPLVSLSSNKGGGGFLRDCSDTGVN